MTQYTQDIGRAAEMLKRARAVVAITGAGISAESGVPTFRGPAGLWRSFRPEDLATPGAFERDPALVWEWYYWRRERVSAASPNPGHAVLARFEARFPHFLLLTQNVDGLHEQAGSRRLVELHGNIFRARCTREPERRFDQRQAPGSAPGVEPGAGPDPSDPRGSGPKGAASAWQARHEAPGPGHEARVALPCCPCGALLRPDVVWFGEGLDQAAMKQAVEAVEGAEAVLVVGTSAVVYPVATLPGLARRAGAAVIEVNTEATPLTAEADLVLRGKAGDILPALERLL